MSTVITMPQQGLTEESSVIAEWYVKEGDAVKVGTPLFAIETGKATFDVESEAEGTVLGIFAAEGDDVPIKAPVCVIGQPGETFERPAGAAAVPDDHLYTRIERLGRHVQDAVPHRQGRRTAGRCH